MPNHNDFRQRRSSALALTLGVILLLASAICPFAVNTAHAQEGFCKTSFTGEATPVEQLWHAHTQGVWYFNAQGEKVLPQIDENWLVVRFPEQGNEDFLPEGTVPEQILEFNEQIQAAITFFLHTPASGINTAIYRVKEGARDFLVSEILGRSNGDSPIQYVIPAFQVDGRPQALTERVTITWKSMTSLEDRTRLLQAIGALHYEPVLDGLSETIQLNPCRMPVWKAANLLAEDIHVASAQPILFRIENPITANFTLKAHGVQAGVPVPFVLNINFSPRLQIEPSTIANLNLRPVEVFRNLFEVKYDTPLSALDVQRSPIHLTGKITFYATGDFEIPGITIYYKDGQAPETGVHQIRTKPLPIRVASLLPSIPGEYTLQVAQPGALQLPNRAATKGRQQSALWLIGAGALGLALCLGILISLSRRQSQQQVKEGPSMAESYAQTELIRILNSFTQTAEPADFAALGQSLRRFLGEACGLPEELQGGCANLFFDTVEGELPPSVRRQTRDLLSNIDTALSSTIIDTELVDETISLTREIVSRLKAEQL